jgi:short-subunit dehydrogenase
MTRALKPLAEQVIVLTGATSGIGLATARMASERGAALMLTSRNEPALRALAEELKARGGRADYAVADVGDAAQVDAVAAAAKTAFGGFDTWINNAAVGLYGRIEDVPLEDQRRVFDTDYWGMVHGSLAAVRALSAREAPGALINVGSILGDQAIPIQGVYSAAKHAVKGFTNALRMETMRSAPQVSVTLIKPSAVDTPYKEHARNYLDHPAANPPPVYDPALVAEAILYAAEHRTREITVGGGGRALALLGQLLPVAAEPLYAWAVPLLHRDRRVNHPHDSDNLRSPGRDLSERTATYRFVRRTSLYTKAQMNPQTTAAVLLAAGAAVLMVRAAARGLKVAHSRAKARAHEREKWKAREAKQAARRGP